MKTIAWFVPDFDAGSGGHRTIFQNFNFLVEKGYECDLYIYNTLHPAIDIRRKCEEHYSKLKGNIYCTDSLIKHYDYVIATYYESAKLAQKADADKKLYFAQDYEPWFFPMCEQKLEAENSYSLELEPISIGRWLAQKLPRKEHGQFFSFCADIDSYKPNKNIKKEKAICCVFQPAKPRRCANLVLKAINLIEHARPDITIYLFGSNKAELRNTKATHLGVLSVPELNELYNKCLAGLCISSSNPSRVPFEMMASGLPVVDLHRENNLYDFPEDGCLLAAPTPEAIASALIKLVDDSTLNAKMSKAGREYMKDFPLNRGFEEFFSAIKHKSSNRKASPKVIRRLYTRGPETSSSEILKISEHVTIFPEVMPEVQSQPTITLSRKNQIIQHSKSIAKKALRKVYKRSKSITQKDILIINGTNNEKSISHRYRVSHLREQLLLNGVSSDEIYHGDLSIEALNHYRGFIFARCPIIPVIDSFIKTAREQHKPVFFETDDLVFDPKYSTDIDAFPRMTTEEKELYLDGVFRYQKTLSRCDYGITSTERLQREMQHYLNEVYINRNVASKEMLECSNRAYNIKKSSNIANAERIVIGYFSGTNTHNADLEMVLPVLKQLLKEHQNLYIKLVGEINPPELSEYEDRVKLEKLVDWRELPSLISSVDINLAPLAPTVFNEAKSENKWMEAALVGVPTVASNYGAFKVAVKQGETGLLCSSLDEWKKNLEKLINNADYRVTIGEKAREKALKDYLTSSKTGLEVSKYILSKLN